MKKALILIAIACATTMCTPTANKEEKVNDEPAKQEEAVQLEVVGEFKTRPGNVAASNDGRVFSTMHPLDKDNNQLVEVKANNEIVPFPNADYQKNGGPAADEKLDTPLGVRVDENNILWVIDMGQNLGKTRLFGFDIATQQEVFRLDFPKEVAPAGSFVQDLAVDEVNGWVYLADIADAGILAVNMKTQTVRRFGNEILAAEDIDMIIDEKVIYFGGVPARVAVNPITLSSDRNSLFFGAMNGTKWYTVPANLFRDNAADSLIAASITVAGDKPISDGVATDAAGNHYFTNLQEDGLDILGTDGVLKPLIRDPKIIWADNVDVKGGYAYFTVNQLHTAPTFTGAEDQGKPPYFIYKIKL